MGVAPIKMPQLGESVTEGTVDRWLKKEGDFVKRDEPLVEVVTDKVNAEIPSPFEGTLVKISVTEGTTVNVGAEIAQIETEAVAAGAAVAPPAAEAPSEAPSEAPKAAAPVDHAASAHGASDASSCGSVAAFGSTAGKSMASGNQSLAFCCAGVGSAAARALSKCRIRQLTSSVFL